MTPCRLKVCDRTVSTPPPCLLRAAPTAPGRAPGLAARLALALLLAGLGMARAATLDEGTINDLYSEAKALCREATALAASDPDGARERFGKAALRLERIVTEGGIRNGRLFYNIGNCYFHTEDLGRAILNYRRAEQYTPNDPNLRQNLDYARRRRLDRIELPERTKALKTLLFFHDDLTQRQRALGAALAWSLLWLCLAGRVLRRSNTLAWLAGLGALVAVLLMGSLAVEWWQWRRVQPGVVVAGEVVARKGDGASFEPAFTAPLHAGAEFRILEDRGGWIEVALDDGRHCWLPSQAVERVR
ncbi:MAG: hypothetical protein GX595_16945 [Lentisphaerae bacterium]|nr:hypothetical protein [Lentisphaerota bacterium]